MLQILTPPTAFPNNNSMGDRCLGVISILRARYVFGPGRGRIALSDPDAFWHNSQVISNRHPAQSSGISVHPPKRWITRWRV